jgi:purine-cytosine permease-like protein
MRFPLVARRIILAPVFGLALALAVSACSSSGSSSSSSTSSAPVSSAAPVSSGPVSSAPVSSAPASSTGNSAAVAQITANWEKFFNSSTPNSERVTLLQNGSAFAGAISGLTSLVSGLGAKVTSVTLTSATTATVKYNLTAGGTSLLNNQTGTAVLDNGVWKVGDASLCALIKLVPGGTAPSACSSAG